MPEMDIDLERVISDPAYRRAVLNALKSETDGKVAPHQDAARAVEAQDQQNAVSK